MINQKVIKIIYFISQVVITFLIFVGILTISLFFHEMGHVMNHEVGVNKISEFCVWNFERDDSGFHFSNTLAFAYLPEGYLPSATESISWHLYKMSGIHISEEQQADILFWISFGMLSIIVFVGNYLQLLSSNTKPKGLNTNKL